MFFTSYRSFFLMLFYFKIISALFCFIVEKWFVFTLIEMGYILEVESFVPLSFGSKIGFQTDHHLNMCGSLLFPFPSIIEVHCAILLGKSNIGSAHIFVFR